jgi:hypothetical protein
MNLNLLQVLSLKRRTRTLFKSPEGEKFLRWLARYCRAARTTWEGDRDAMLILEGRRQVWLAIREQLDLSDEKVAELMEETDENE